MERKKTTDSIVSAYRLINNAKLSKMETEEKFAFIKAVRQLKKVGVNFDDLLNDAQERLKNEDTAAILTKIQSNEKLSAEENAAFNKYNQDVTACLKEELDKEIDVDFEPLSKEAFGHFIASNDFSVNQILLIEDVLCA